MPTSPEGYERLTCSCGTERFAKVTYLRWKDGSGLIEEPGGYFCLECHTTVNSSALIDKAKLKVKHRELKELQDEIGIPRNEEQANAVKERPVSSGAKGR